MDGYNLPYYYGYYTYYMVTKEAEKQIIATKDLFVKNSNYEIDYNIYLCQHPEEMANAESYIKTSLSINDYMNILFVPPSTFMIGKLIQSGYRVYRNDKTKNTKNTFTKSKKNFEKSRQHIQKNYNKNTKNVSHISKKTFR